MIGRFFVVGMFMMINLGLAVGMMFARHVSAAPPAGADTLPGAAGGPLGGGLDQPVQSELLRPAQPGPHPARHLP